MSNVKEELMQHAWQLFRETSEEPRGSYSRDIWGLEQLGEHIYQYNTGYEYKDGSSEGNKCEVVWFENGKLTPLKTVDLWNGYATGPGGKLFEDEGNGIYASFRTDRRQLGYNDYETYTTRDGGFVKISEKGIDEIKSDLSNLEEKDFLRLYGKLFRSRKYRDSVKQRTFDLSGKWGEPSKLLHNRIKKLFEVDGVDNEWLRQSPQEKKELIEAINDSYNKKYVVDENRLSDLKGISIKELDGDLSAKEMMAIEIYGASDLSGLLQVAVEAPDTPAFDLISALYRENYGSEIVDGITERAEDIIKLPYKRSFFEQISGDRTITVEANFLDEFTDRIRDLAMDKYGQEDWYTSISEAAKNPEFMKDANQIWDKMFAEVDKHITYKPNDHNNAYIREMFPDKVEQLHGYVDTTSGNFSKVLDDTIEYYSKVGKMQKAIREYMADNDVYLNGNLHFDLVNAGIETKREAKRCLDIWQASNERPDRYGSPYNEYSIKEIAHIAKSNVMQAWMYPVMMEAVEKGSLTLSEGRMPSERTLFDCCKAWKVNPAMPQRLAKRVGGYSLKNRMLAGAIFEQMSKKGNTTKNEWLENKELHQKFYEELNRAQKMPIQEAFKQYIPNTPINKKRLIGMGMEEKGIKNTPDNFRKLYRKANEQGIFEKTLAKPEDARTTFSARLLVETARKINAR